MVLALARGSSGPLAQWHAVLASYLDGNVWVRLHAGFKRLLFRGCLVLTSVDIFFPDHGVCMLELGPAPNVLDD